MKRLILLLLLVFLLTSCSDSDLSCRELFNTLPIVTDQAETYAYRSDLTDGPFFSMLYLGKNEASKPHAFEYCDDYYVVLSSGSELWELHIFRVNSRYDTEAVFHMLTTRKERLQASENMLFYSESTQERVMKARVFVQSSFVVLSITDQNELIEKEIHQQLQ